MPKRPQGQKCPADVIGSAILVASLATGEISEDLKEPSDRVRSGVAGGGRVRAEFMTKEGRSAAAKQAAAARWG